MNPPGPAYIVGSVDRLDARERAQLAALCAKANAGSLVAAPKAAVPHLRAWLADVSFRDWQFLLRLDGARPYLQVAAPDDGGWASRKWFLSPHMTHSEIVQTAFKAVLTATEHEVREAFRYKGHAVYSPHYDVERLVELLSTDAALELRSDQ